MEVVAMTKIENENQLNQFPISKCSPDRYRGCVVQVAFLLNEIRAGKI